VIALTTLLVTIGLALIVQRYIPPVTGEARALDGDSLRVGEDEIRIFGIDAPEARQVCRRREQAWACGEAATREMRDLVRGRPVTCRGVDIDRYGRTVARCTAGGQDLGAAMVRAGLAIASGAYEADERDARDAKRGLWDSQFERPADWRARHPRHAGAVDGKPDD
jgi:endonuclease YncB( thermonuclease family)